MNFYSRAGAGSQKRMKSGMIRVKWQVPHALRGVVTPGRLELPTRSLGNCCSIHLSYGATFGRLVAAVSGNCWALWLTALAGGGHLSYGATLGVWSQQFQETTGALWLTALAGGGHLSYGATSGVATARSLGVATA